MNKRVTKGDIRIYLMMWKGAIMTVCVASLVGIILGPVYLLIIFPLKKMIRRYSIDFSDLLKGL
ncbi:MAG: hypothetical protein COX02_02100 [Candidatus Vogelbacteria bacterium CG22_combo_CG10-13_8_21_14_all_37_9]|uniref:Uncharacterized protein n=1 Tax=Candidatus Vogelbacteria bacterium CG22_combo_CG10-13_8_21_14_all_37_9 TaxID=1975046 RepID=A0A2H0BKA4_9BACT|nr:MAG: hypothetical protein BK005_01870 [bacterium CG10_37_50]PIP58092.1 MAG: hypothetical protein COX02_02100 [Candidatus Vogelbacteria bacterium CG22_combo_CG10-13_8_21_14_all_37_9]